MYPTPETYKGYRESLAYFWKKYRLAHEVGHKQLVAPAAEALVNRMKSKSYCVYFMQHASLFLSNLFASMGFKLKYKQSSLSYVEEVKMHGISGLEHNFPLVAEKENTVVLISDKIDLAAIGDIQLEQARKNRKALALLLLESSKARNTDEYKSFQDLKINVKDDVENLGKWRMQQLKMNKSKITLANLFGVGYLLEPNPNLVAKVLELCPKYPSDSSELSRIADNMGLMDFVDQPLDYLPIYGAYACGGFDLQTLPEHIMLGRDALNYPIGRGRFAKLEVRKALNDPSEVGEILKNMKIVEVKQDWTIERILPKGKEIIQTRILAKPPESPVKVVINYANKILDIVRRLRG